MRSKEELKNLYAIEDTMQFVRSSSLVRMKADKFFIKMVMVNQINGKRPR